MNKKESLRAQYDRFMLPVYSPPAPVFAEGKGSRVRDAEGREYLDFGGGIAVLSLGHCDAEVCEAAAMQMQKLAHVSNLFASEAAIRLARELARLTFAERVFLCNSGAEANEAAIKLARRRGTKKKKEKHRVLSFSGGFHGRLGFAMTATHQEKIRGGFGPLADGFLCSPFNDLAAAQKTADDSLCAIIAEPTQGEGGVFPADNNFLRGLRELADAKDALLIFDEVQTGVGRTGELYQYMSCGIAPDILTTAKGLGNGFPVAAMLAGARAADVLGAGDHGATFGGNPVAAAAALAVLRRVQKKDFLKNVQEKSKEFLRRLQKLNGAFGCFGEMRASGLLIGCDAAKGMQAKEMCAAMLSEGVVVITAGKNTLRFAPALNISGEDIKEGFARMQKALAFLRSQK